MKKKVLTAMSGGVDSSVAAYLLKERGYDVVGVTFKLWHKNDSPDMEDAKSAAGFLGIPHYIISAEDLFKERVVDYFVNEYLSGKTPNPCVACNKNVKWNVLLAKAVELGADYVATGHYARAAFENDRYCVKTSKTVSKDQSYALYGLTQEQLSATLLPVGDYTKDEIRKIAAEIGLNVHDKKDSQEICFVPGKDYGGFIGEYMELPQKRGDFIDVHGNVLASHKGIAYYTVGQRKGLGISSANPLYVLSIDAASNTVVLGADADLYENTMTVKDVNFMSVGGISDEMSLQCKIRYGHIPAACTVKPSGDDIICVFTEKQRAITKGQSAVFYDGDKVAFGGVIC